MIKGGCWKRIWPLHRGPWQFSLLLPWQCMVHDASIITYHRCAKVAEHARDILEKKASSTYYPTIHTDHFSSMKGCVRLQDSFSRKLTRLVLVSCRNAAPPSCHAPDHQLLPQQGYQERCPKSSAHGRTTSNRDSLVHVPPLQTCIGCPYLVGARNGVDCMWFPCLKWGCEINRSGRKWTQGGLWACKAKVANLRLSENRVCCKAMSLQILQWVSDVVWSAVPRHEVVAATSNAQRFVSALRG